MRSLGFPCASFSVFVESQKADDCLARSVNIGPEGPLAPPARKSGG